MSRSVVKSVVLMDVIDARDFAAPVGAAISGFGVALRVRCK